VARYVVTGCAGFIGSHLVDSLVRRGDTVVGIDSFSDYYPRALKQANLAPVMDDTRFRLVEGDLADISLEPLLEGAAGIFHVAAQPGVRGSWGDSFQIYAHDNVVASQRVFEAAGRLGMRVIFASSSSIYGNAESYPVGEDSSPRPVSPYGVTKLTCEHLAGAYAAGFGLDVVVLRYFTVYGPRQRPDMAFARIANALSEGNTFRVFGDGEQSRDFTFVSDAVSAALLSMQEAPGGAVYNVGGGTEASMREVIQLAEDLSGERLNVQREDAATGDVRRTAADTQRIRHETGWAPSVSLEEGLRVQLEWMFEKRSRLSETELSR
jgi:UDP-glucuronate 4-epimerase